MRQIYFLRRADGTGPIKIGCSAYIKSRVYQIGVDYGATFEVLASAPGDYITERNLHLKFEATRAAMPSRREGRKGQIAGWSEWFGPSPKLLKLIDTVRSTGEISLAKHECRERLFAERYLAGETLKQIGDDFGLTRERVRQVLRRHGVESLGHRPEHRVTAHNLTPTEIAAVEAYSAGELSSAICERHGLTRTQLLTACRRLDVAIRAPGAPFRSDCQQTCDRLANLYREGASLEAISSEFGWSHVTYVYRWLRRAGVTPTRRPRRLIAA